MAPGEAVAGLTPVAYARAVVDGGAGASAARRLCAYLLTTVLGGAGSVVLLVGARLHPDRAGVFEGAALMWFLAFGVCRSALLGRIGCGPSGETNGPKPPFAASGGRIRRS
jgi:hypothetical protein